MLSSTNLFDLGRLATAGMLLLFPSFVFSAGNPKLLERAEESFYEENLETALQLFDEYLREDPNHKKAQYHIEICSLLTYYPTKPLDRLFELESTVGNKDKFYNYWMGRIYAARYDFKSAIAAWNSFLNLKVYKSKEIVDETKRFIAEAEARLFYVNNSTPFLVYQLSSEVNTEHSEIGPVLVNDGTQMMLSRIVAEGKKSLHSETVTYDKKSFKDWAATQSQSPSPDFGQDMVVLQSFRGDSKRLIMNVGKKGGFYEAEWLGDRWSTLEEIEIIENASSAAFSESGQHLFFSALSQDGSTQTDLYQCSLQSDGKWSAPRALKELNSIMDESGVFLSEDGNTIFFSSKRLGGMGGFDIFRSTYDLASGTWNSPTNLGFPMNTPGDELFFKLNKDAKTGFLASNRAGSNGMLDTYFFMEEVKQKVQGKVFASGINKPVSGVEIKLNVVGESDRTTVAYTDREGNFDALISCGFTYELEFYLDNSLLKTERFELAYEEANTSPVKKSFEVDVPHQMVAEMRTSGEVLESNTVSEYTVIEDLGKKFSLGNTANLDQIYFDPGSDYVSSEYTPHLTALYQLMRDNPELKIEIIGYCDGSESEEDDKNLSLLRARSIGSYLIQRKIDYRRIREVGQPSGQVKAQLAINQTNSNRRIQVSVIE